jgi:hypothetical protein
VDKRKLLANALKIGVAMPVVMTVGRSAAAKSAKGSATHS